MASRSRSSLARLLPLAVAGAVVVTALTVASAGASPPTPLGGTDAQLSRPGASPSHTRGVSSPPPGFLLERGRFKPVAIPRGLEDLAPEGIGPFGINNQEQIVGEYVDGRGAGRGFLLDRGRFTRIDVPGAKATNAQKINNRGQIVGMYSDTSTVLEDPGVPLRGFLYDRGRYIRIDPPGAVSSQALGVNDKGQVVGDYQDADGVFHGYVWERGRFRTIDRPSTAATSATDINNRGQITGVTGDPTAGSVVGFVLDRGRFRTFQVRGAPFTFPFDINERGQIVGYSARDLTLTAGTISGFLRDPGGRFTAINRPGASLTAAFGINDRGQIVGVASDPEATPSPQFTTAPPMGQMA
jgi:probable HAF family extracellular repeat protein